MGDYMWGVLIKHQLRALDDNYFNGTVLCLKLFCLRSGIKNDVFSAIRNLWMVKIDKEKSTQVWAIGLKWAFSAYALKASASYLQK